MTESAILRLRPTAIADLDFVLWAEQHEDNRTFVTQWTQQQHEATFTNADCSHLIIEQIQDCCPVGYVILAGLTNVHQSIELLRLVITHKGQGYGKITLKLVQQIAFEQLYAHRLWLDVKDYNSRARHVYQTVGFVEEGKLRDCIKSGDRFESLIILSMLRPEYIALSESRFASS